MEKPFKAGSHIYPVIKTESLLRQIYGKSALKGF